MASKPRKRPDRGWLVEWTRIRDGKRTSRTLPTEREAWRFWRELEALHARGEAWVPRAVRGQPDAHELAERWLMECQTRNGHRTLVRKGQMIGAFLRRLDEDAGHDREPDDHGRGIYLCDLELHDELVAHHAWLGMERTGRHFHGRLPSTTGKHLAEVSRWLHWCWERGHIDRPGPDVGADGRLHRAGDRPQAAGARAHAKRWPGGPVPPEMTASSRLTSSHVRRITCPLLHIRPELGKTSQERRGRIVPLSHHLVVELAGWGRREGWLIDRTRMPGRPSGKASSRHPNRTVPRKAWERSGVEDPAVYAQPLHCFRKGFISELTALGVDTDVRKYLVGHATGVHGDVYTVMEAPTRAAVKKIPAVGRGSVVSLDKARKA